MDLRPTVQTPQLVPPALPRRGRSPVSFGRAVRAVVSLVLVFLGRFWRWLRRSSGCGGFVSINTFVRARRLRRFRLGFVSRLMLVTAVSFCFVSRLVLVLGVAVGAKKLGGEKSGGEKSTFLALVFHVK